MEMRSILGIAQGGRAKRLGGRRGVGLAAGLVALAAIVTVIGGARTLAVDSRDAASALARVQVVDVAAAGRGMDGGDPRMQALATVDDAIVRAGVVDDARAWHAHGLEDEFVLAIDAEFYVDVRDDNGDERSFALAQNEGVTIPAGMTHRVRSDERASMLSFLTSSAVSGIDGVE